LPAGPVTVLSPDPAGVNRHETGDDRPRLLTLTVTRPVKLGTGRLRVEFTTLMGLTGPDAIAVSGVRSR
jgi:hypothetical protein